MLRMSDARLLALRSMCSRGLEGLPAGAASKEVRMGLGRADDVLFRHDPMALDDETNNDGQRSVSEKIASEVWELWEQRAKHANYGGDSLRQRGGNSSFAPCGARLNSLRSASSTRCMTRSFGAGVEL